MPGLDPRPAAQAPIVIVGGGPAGPMAAEHLATAGERVILAERMPSLGRKLLMAGRGGLNLTHAEMLPRFLSRYGQDAPILRNAIEAFPAEALRAWADGLGAETFIGSSGRVFPKAMKASPLLRAWIARLAGLGVEFRLRYRWLGRDAGGNSVFGTPDGQVVFPARATLLALGGASWPRLGADGSWLPHLAEQGVAITPFAPANAGLLIAWSPYLVDRFAGAPLKRIAASFGNDWVRGEAVLTRQGLEGGAIYALATEARSALALGGATLRLDLRPDLTQAEIVTRLSQTGRPGDSFANRLRKALELPPVAIGLLNEHGQALGVKPANLSPTTLARRIKALSLPVAGLAGLDRAISTAGGLQFDELDGRFMLRRLPGLFAAGEMLDWEAPTGGYLLQACFATGVAAARGMRAWLAEARG